MKKVLPVLAVVLIFVLGLGIMLYPTIANYVNARSQTVAIDHYEEAARANAAYYEQEAMRYPGVAAAKAVGRARGIGTVNVVIATHAGVPDAALLAAVETDLQKKREIAVDVKVLAPTVETVAVTAALKAAPGYTFAEVKAGAQSALEELFTGELLGKSVTTARLLTLLCGVEGVENVHLTAPAADVAVGSTELPMLGTVTLSELTEA